MKNFTMAKRNREKKKTKTRERERGALEVRNVVDTNDKPQ